MASWIEIERIRKDPKAFKLLAGHLLTDANYSRARSESCLSVAANSTEYFSRADLASFSFPESWESTHVS
jgi:hypothetical protein